MESETPRTDENEWMTRTEVDDPTTGLTVRDEAVVDADLARELERELAAEKATTASLLRSLALIREAGGWEKQMLSELPDAVKAMRQQRDEAHGLIRKWRLNLVDIVEIGDFMDAMTSEGRCPMNAADKRAFLEATCKKGGGE